MFIPQHPITEYDPSILTDFTPTRIDRLIEVYLSKKEYIENPIDMTEWINDGNRKAFVRELMIFLKTTDPQKYRELLETLPPQDAKNIDARISRYIQEGIDIVPQPDNMAYIPIYNWIKNNHIENDTVWKQLQKIYDLGKQRVIETILDPYYENKAFYALSHKNLESRPAKNVRVILDVVKDACESFRHISKKTGMRFEFVGNLEELAQHGQGEYSSHTREFLKTQEYSEKHAQEDAPTIYILANFNPKEYVREAIKENKDDTPQFQRLTSPDLIVRTGNEWRISELPILGTTELAILPKYWIDITPLDRLEIYNNYHARDIRHGK